MEAVMITEADLEGMMKILRTEIDRPRFWPCTYLCIDFGDKIAL
jgi:hypothetical protein